MRIDVQYGGSGPTPTVLTVGSYDGVHKGHLSILQTVIAESKRLGLTSLVASFDPHPRFVLSGIYPSLLSPGEERRELLQKLGIDSHVLIEFNRELAAMSAQDYVKDVLIGQLNMKVIVVGHDHKFGKNREGNTAMLRQLSPLLGFDVIECDEINAAGNEISSSKIRQFIREGRVAEAKDCLGRHYHVQGSVIRGAGRGKGIGIPTANMGHLPDYKLVPKNGVYAVKVEVQGHEGRENGMMNIGTRPTFNGDAKVTLEVNILNFNQDIYDREVRVEFVQRIRDERKFASVDQLLEQLNTDRLRCSSLLSAIS